MINDRKTLKYYLENDKKALGIKKKRPSLFGDEIWKFQIVLRKHEFYLNTNKKIRRIIFHLLHHNMGLKLGFTIPCNVFGPGLCLHHWGCIVVNEKARIGAWCECFQMVNIGENFRGGAPQIGDNAFIGPGAKIFGDVVLGDNIMIGANSVINSSFEGESITLAGVPAVIVNSNNNRDKRLHDINT